MACRRLPGAACLCVAALLLGTSGMAADQIPAERGRLLLAQFRCGSCHAIPGVEDARGISAAPLQKWGRRSYIAGRLPNQPDILAAWISDPQALVPSTTMPALGVSAAQARDMAAYLHGLR